MRSVDVLVVGSGLSGTVATSRLHSAGADVLCIDRLADDRHSRYHSICGEALSDRTFMEMGMEPVCVRDRITKVRENWPGDVSITESAHGYIVDRPGLLRHLRKGCGQSFENLSLRSVERMNEGFLASTDGGEIRCKRLLGADGAFSIVRKDILRHRPKELIAVKQFIVDEEAEEGVIEFTYGGRYGGGYRWAFPCDGMSNQGFPRGCGEAPKNTVEEGARYIPIGPSGPVEDRGAYLLGDAGAMVNPLSFGGIRVAMLSGMKAAESVISGAEGRYQAWWDGCGFSDPLFWKVYETTRRWDDGRMADFIHPFRRGYGVYGMVRSLLRGGETALVAKGYMRSFRYGW